MKSLCSTLVISLLFLSGCQTLDDVNDGARSGGEITGKILTIPQSVNEGINNAQHGKKSANPYKR